MPEESANFLQFYRSEIKFESTMLSNRLNAFISSQSFLVLGYASAMGASLGQWHNPFVLAFPPSLALLGLVLSLYAWPGIKAAYAVIEQWHTREDELFSRHPDLHQHFLPAPSAMARGAVMRSRFRQGALFAKHTPWIFALAWCYFGALPVFLYAHG